MAKIPHLHPAPRADGTIAWHWKPSPRLRASGWVNKLLGTSSAPAGRRKPSPPVDVIAAAQALNDSVAAWDLGCTTTTTKAPPRRYTWDDLVAEYRASSEFTTKASSTRREYDVRLGQLRHWALDGCLHVDAIDEDLVRDLKRALQEGSPFKCAAMLRVLHLLMGWARVQRIIANNPCEAVTIPATPSRRSRLTWQDLLDAAQGRQADDYALRVLRVGFWSMQRRADLAQFNRFAWREMHGADPRDVPALANARGEVWGFRITQEKTGATVDCPMPPFLHAEIETAFASSQWLFPGIDPKLAISGDVIRRRTRPVLDAAGFPHIQLRDMRRSGMSWVTDMGADRADVFAISGHPLLGNQRTMADVYMPPDTRSACRAIAAACRTLVSLEERQNVPDSRNLHE